MDEILEYLELGEIENYLFLPPDIDVKMCLEKEFTPEKIDSLEKAKNAPCIFNNWANFYKGKFISNTILNANAFEKLLK
mgnify:CR=1 FL=1